MGSSSEQPIRRSRLIKERKQNFKLIEVPTRKLNKSYYRSGELSQIANYNMPGLQIFKYSHPPYIYELFCNLIV